MAETQYATRGVVSRDVVARTFDDALAVAAEWGGCYEVVVREGDGEWRPLFVRLVEATGAAAHA